MISIGQNIALRYRYRVARMVYHYDRTYGYSRFRAGCDAVAVFFRGYL